MRRHSTRLCAWLVFLSAALAARSQTPPPAAPAVAPSAVAPAAPASAIAPAVAPAAPASAIAPAAPASAVAPAAPTSIATTADASTAVRTVEFASDSVGRKMKFNVILPAGYEGSPKRYPVLYLLHGYSSNYTAWARMNVPKYAAGYDLIVVMPDAGNSWYANWTHAEEPGRNRWEDYMVKDLIGFVDANYRTVADRSGRAINGLSMGGYGALALGLKHPELFCSIGSHSGAVGFAKRAGERLRAGEDPAKKKGTRTPSETPNPAIGIEGFNSQAERSPKGKLFTTPEEADAFDPFKLAPAVPKEMMPHIYIDCGTEDSLLQSNQDFVKVLMGHKVPFTYAEGPGGHSPAYWAREVGHSMAVQNHILQRNLAISATASGDPAKPAPAP